MSDFMVETFVTVEQWIKSLLHEDERGQGMVEYGLIIAVVAIGAIALLGAFRDQIATAFNNIGTSFVNATP